MCESQTVVIVSERIAALHQLGQVLQDRLDGDLDGVIQKAIEENGWFTQASIKKAIRGIIDAYLDKGILEAWSDNYNTGPFQPKKVGLILAGNIPLVGIHDIVSVFVSGHISMIKCSSKDKVLILHLLDLLGEIDARTQSYFEVVDQLKGMEAVIATGGETAATHFEYYFSKYPHIIRKNRSSCAVLTGFESKEELTKLGHDIFDYFGLGCRSVSKIYVPDGFNFDRFFEAIVSFGHVIDHNKYKNNFDYSYSIYLLGQHPFLTNNFLIIREDQSLASRIACLHYEFYRDLNNLETQLEGLKDNLQCVASQTSLGTIQTIPLGTCQSPAIDDYADGVDTLAFLSNLNGRHNDES